MLYNLMIPTKTLRQLKRLCLLGTLLLPLVSCDDPNEMGLELEDGPMSVFYTDTVTVHVSTVQLDSVVTSGMGTILVGNYSDPLVSKTATHAYFQVGLGNSWALDEESVFESVELVLPYTGYSYGDTTQAIQLDVHRLVNSIQETTLPPYVGTETAGSYFYTTSGLYNTSKTAVASQPLTSYTFTPRPGSLDSLFIPLPDALGEEWFSLQQQSNNSLQSTEAFLDYFRGLRLSASTGGAVVGFNAAGAVIRLQYRVSSTEGSTGYYQDFPLITGSTQYNHIAADFSSSYLSGIERGGDPVASTATGNMSFAQSGTGLMVRLDFPYLNDLKEILVPALINGVQLEVQPVANTIKYPFAAPATVSLYETDLNSKPLSLLLQDYSEEVQTAALKADDEYSLNSKYSFNITHYLIGRLNATQPQDRALLLGAPAAEFVQAVNRLAVGGQGAAANKVKLRIYYTKLN
ncbi:DUF4270 domain-containing protein [Pontibacter qinzhouensis]|uniref:DUF4270 domain-containing protein n=1 Tax=Pontibacter qinzhouensis TaxID=2603253 RepID=A0A5C8K510_9BACT|nr:DUF4270 family protein [Pontibacter qinzhouensis]TXK45708.1 DUF4270 domain-containing protein [Pontibacter qinzhouensis]